MPTTVTCLPACNVVHDDANLRCGNEIVLLCRTVQGSVLTNDGVRLVVGSHRLLDLARLGGPPQVRRVQVRVLGSWVGVGSSRSRDTVGRGAAELEAGVVADGRVRAPGAGRKPAEETDPDLWPALDTLVDPQPDGRLPVGGPRRPAAGR